MLNQISPYLIFLNQKRFGSLDGLRALSIFAVIWHHTAPKSVNPIFAVIGTYGVTLFFAISGFLITTLLIRENVKNGKIDLKAFYMRRALRIFPLYYLILLLYIVIVLLFEKDLLIANAFFHNLIYFATYTSNLFVPLDGRVIFYFSWSLAAEEQFYIIWPSLLILAATRLNAAVLLFSLIGISLVGVYADNRFFAAVPFSILVGAFYATVLHSERGFALLYSFLGRKWSPVMLFVLFAFVFSTMQNMNFLLHFILATIVASCVITEAHYLSGIFMFKPLAYIGSISYGMYMLHMIAKNAVTKLFGRIDRSSDRNRLALSIYFDRFNRSSKFHVQILRVVLPSFKNET